MSDEDLRDITTLANEYADEVDASVRRLGLGGIALIWLFRISSNADTLLPLGFRWPMVLLVSALALDFLQSVAGAWFFSRHIKFVVGDSLTGWKARMRAVLVSRQYAGGAKSEGFRPVAWLFWPKIAFTVAAYVWLIVALSREIMFA